MISSRPESLRDERGMPSSSSASGFTLIEIIMVLVVFGMMYVAAPRLNIFGTDNNTKLSQLRSDFRSAYDMAVINNKAYRLVFQFASGDYWLEQADSPGIVLGDDGIDKDPFDDEQARKESEFEEEFSNYEEIAGKAQLDPESSEEATIHTPLIDAKKRLEHLRVPKWTMVENAEWGKRSLGPGLLIKGMQAWHHNAYQGLNDLGQDARAAVYILPPGYIEPAYIHIAYNNGSNEVDEKQKPYTLIVNSYGGVVDVENDEREVDLKNPEIKKL